MAKIYMTIGLPGSGKSTLAARLRQELNAVIVSRDELRFMIYGGTYKYDAAYEPLIKDMAVSCARCATCSERNVILDETNLTRSGRAWWVELFKREGHQVTYLHCPEKRFNVQNRMLGGGRAYDAAYLSKVINRLDATYEAPDLSEGVEEIKVYPII